MQLPATGLCCGLWALTFGAPFADRIPEDGLLCYQAEGDPRLLGQISAHARRVAESRKECKILYFFKLPDPLERSFASDAKGRIVEREGRHIGGADITFYVDERGRQIVRHRKRPAPKETLEEAARTYRELLSNLGEDSAKRYVSPVPFHFLGARLYPVADEFYPAPYDLEKVRAGYESKPSGLGALVYLELALVERDLAQRERSHSLLEKPAEPLELLELARAEWAADQLARLRSTLEEAVHKLDLLNIDFRKDGDFRQHLHERFNFARPECVLLFLAGDVAAKSGEPEVAEKYYSILIERAPASPFAWESFSKLARLPGVQQNRISQLEQFLVETYPLVWGCRRDALKVGPSEVKSTVSTLLRAFGP